MKTSEGAEESKNLLKVHELIKIGRHNHQHIAQ
jgi:hypothetical protein